MLYDIPWLLESLRLSAVPYNTVELDNGWILV